MEETISEMTSLNQTLLFSSKEEIVTPLFWGDVLAIALLKLQSFLNVSRGNTALYIFFLLVKNAFVCHAIPNLSPPSSISLYFVLKVMRMLWPMPYNLHLGFISLDLVMVAYLSFCNSEAVRDIDFSPLSETKCFLISFTVLTGLSIFSPTHSFIEFVVDFFCIAKLTWYISDPIWECYGTDILTFFAKPILFLLFLTIDAILGTRCLLFDLFCILIACIYFMAEAIADSRPIQALVFTVILAYCVYERINKHISHFQFQNWQISMMREHMIITGDQSEKVALQFFRF